MSQGLIRLKKVKVAPKRNLSIIKKTVYKKQLSVRFADQRPIETIKHLSQDIDELSQVIDAYFPLKSSECENSSISPETSSKLKNLNISEVSTKTTNFASNIQTRLAFRSDEISSSFASEGVKDLKKIEGNDLNDSKNSTISRGSKEIDLRIKYKNMAPAEEYGYDFRVVKNGGRIQLNDFRMNNVIVESDLVTPKIVKQTRPTKRVSKIKRRNIMDVLVAT
jgi:hypothetical protein